MPTANVGHAGSKIYLGKNLMKILLAEDSAMYRRIIGDHLKEWGFEAVIARDGKEAWAAIRGDDPPKLLLLDWVLPEVEGIELCRRIRTLSKQKSYAYIVLLTANDSKDELLLGMEAGADDYLVKPFDPGELRARLLVGKRILALQEDLVQARASLRKAATTDFLTGLPNRREILASLERELSRGERQSSPVGVIMADIDHFKKINDSLGHAAGDFVLKEVASRFRSDLRKYDGVGRYGGEEFLLILPGCDILATIRRAEGIRKCVCAHEVTTTDGAVQVTASMGATSAQHDRKVTIESLLGEADKALYRAKENGRNRVEGFGPSIHTP
jgi:two-component system, cell cycle response regulator